MVSGIKAGYIEKVMALNNGFHKIVEEVMCLRSNTRAPILQIHRHRCICTKIETQIHTDKGIQIHCSQLDVCQGESRTKTSPACSQLKYLYSEIILILVYSIRT